MKRIIYAALFVLSIAFLFCVISLHVYAAPLASFPIVIEQPNGEQIQCFANGDEYFNYITDENGNIIIKNDITGYYSYAYILDGEVLPGVIVDNNSETAVLMQSDGTSSLTIDTLPNTYIDSIRNNNSILQSESISEDAELLESNNRLDASHKTLDYHNKTITNIVIFIDFNGSSFARKNISSYDEVFNTGVKSMKNYFNEVSYGKTDINSVFCIAPESTQIVTYTSPNSRSYYKEATGEERVSRQYELLSNAIGWAITNDYIPNNIDLDVNGDGLVDSITFILEGTIGTSSDSIFWPHQWNFCSLQGDEPNIYYNDLEFGNFSVNLEHVLMYESTGGLYQTQSASVCHETLHMVFEMPDLYYGYRTPRKNNNAVGDWDIMCSSNGAHMNSYYKHVYGKWIDMPEITETGRYTLNPVTQSDNNCFFIRSPFSSNEFFVLEYRKKGGVNSFEYSIPNSGLIIYRINNVEYGNYDSGVDGCREEVYVYRQSNSKDANDAFYLNTDDSIVLKLRLDEETSTSYNVKNGEIAGITISNVSMAYNTISFDVVFTNESQYDFHDIRVAETIAGIFHKTPAEMSDEDFENVYSVTLSNIEFGYDLPYNLKGIEKCVNLSSISIAGCGVADISPLSSLTSLSYLDLRYNNITDISLISNLSEIETLYLRGNLIDNLTTLSAIYPSILNKDFSLSNNDLIIRVEGFDYFQNQASLEIDTSEYLPEYVYVYYKLCNSFGDVLDETQYRAYISEIEDNMLQLPVSDDGKLIIGTGNKIYIEIFERKDYQQSIYKTQIHPVLFSFATNSTIETEG